jgi:subtilase family serine protease
MTRAECEAKIAAEVEKIIGILKEYNPECEYLTVGYFASDFGSSFFFNNEYWGNDAERPINYCKQI